MDVLLINGIDYQVKVLNPQIGQLILRDILKEWYSVECINFDYLAKKNKIKFKDNLWDNISLFTEYILEKTPKIVGFYTICNSFLTAMLIAKQIKEKKPSIKIIFGGPHATVTAKECLEDFDFIDAICLGESEKTIKALVDALMNNQDLSKLKGVASKYNNRIFINERESMISNEELTKYTPFDYSPVEVTSNQAIELEAGRGCPFACTFCSTSPFWGRQFRIKPVDELIKEMKQFYNLYGVTKFSLVHDLFTVNKKHLTEFCNRIMQEEVYFSWGCSSRVDVLDEDILSLMKKAHCTSIYLGIETGSPSMQKKINKKLNLDHALSMINCIDQLGMEFMASFIYGYPEETVDEFKDTIRMMEKILMTGIRNVQLHRFMLLPHTNETERNYHLAYFDDNDVDFSIYDEKLYDDKAKEIILKYPREFIQFYTFHSEVREKYKLFDSFHYYLVCLMGVYNCCIRYLIRKYGMEQLYFKYLDDIRKVYDELREMGIDIGSQLNSGLPAMYSFGHLMLQDELTNNYTIELDQLIRYENLLKDYVESKDKSPKYYRFSFDVIKARKECVYIEKECIVKFYYEGDKLRVSKVSIQSKVN